ncbi:radical SAM protein [Hespellia stercorisuis]|uniref:Radical SAM superfamily protein n=1 Tax=Hespellia stercorisuis DSM 15480 TaxID=1121950 RepID=A0A1M6QBI2_9FIRM|nr:radical SAM protein [Hespellia stercorisuis]SHK17629.1 Radical SAM superfamily protein [Hespellia stercorisuis DSM 15480]
MNYEGQICRAPMERSSYMLPVMVGCSYNQCKFCNLFRHLKYRELPMEQIEADLKRVYGAGGKPKTIFLGDGNAFDMKTERLYEILDLIEHYFPERAAVNMDATVTGILRKSDEELETLFEKGVRHLYLGIESGLDDVLAFMKKDHNLEQAYTAIDRLHKAGLIFDAHIMTGVAGKGRSTENAEALAEFLNHTQPAHVVNFSMFLHKEVPLYKDVENGSYQPADELESLQEERHLLELLGTEQMPAIRYEGFHDYIEVRTRGMLPADREKMLAGLDRAIAEQEKEEPVYSLVYGECPNLEKCDESGSVWTI